MKRNFSFLLCWIFFLPVVSAQNLADYYAPGKERRKVEQWMFQSGSPALERWYVGTEGFLRSDKGRVSASSNSISSANAVTAAGWGILVGYSKREQWAVEAGFVRSPIHNELKVDNRPYPYTIRVRNERNAFVLRGKRLLLSTSRIPTRAGFWLTGGAWLVPNLGNLESRVVSEGYEMKGYRIEPEAPGLMSRTRTTGLAELGLEYNVRPTDRMDLGFTVRRNWGIGNPLNTEMNYVVTNRPMQSSTLQTNGSGMSFGLAVRYTFSVKRNFINKSVFDLQGKRPLKL